MGLGNEKYLVFEGLNLASFPYEHAPTRAEFSYNISADSGGFAASEQAGFVVQRRKNLRAVSYSILFRDEGKNYKTSALSGVTELFNAEEEKTGAYEYQGSATYVLNAATTNFEVESNTKERRSYDVDEDEWSAWGSVSASSGVQSVQLDDDGDPLGSEATESLTVEFTNGDATATVDGQVPEWDEWEYIRGQIIYSNSQGATGETRLDSTYAERTDYQYKVWFATPSTLKLEATWYESQALTDDGGGADAIDYEPIASLEPLPLGGAMVGRSFVSSAAIVGEPVGWVEPVYPTEDNDKGFTFSATAIKPGQIHRWTQTSYNYPDDWLADITFRRPGSSELITIAHTLIYGDYNADGERPLLWIEIDDQELPLSDFGSIGNLQDPHGYADTIRPVIEVYESGAAKLGYIYATGGKLLTASIRPAEVGSSVSGGFIRTRFEGQQVGSSIFDYFAFVRVVPVGGSLKTETFNGMPAGFDIDDYTTWWGSETFDLYSEWPSADSLPDSADTPGDEFAWTRKKHARGFVFNPY